MCAILKISGKQNFYSTQIANLPSTIVHSVYNPAMFECKMLATHLQYADQI